ncbi:MAG: GH32 C-terminal domain-containing protein [Bryobacterales bacterium]|nr:GH32 C-terminal domain-containing protein [Bryobacterales bacterium]MDE0628669.1 GH32 C-terminal domain-containing protein [Bryobacterales bacterium]
MPIIHGNAIEVATAIDWGKASTVELNVLRSAIAEEVTRILFHGRSGYRRNAFGRKSPLASRFSSVISIDNSRSSELPGSRPRPPETGQFHLRPNVPPKPRGSSDRSVAEVIADGRRCAALRVYPGRKDSVSA